ncbi:Spo0E like sporulation regulatory protein [Caminicella sporogenes DSM 14501]|uniref:Spo0E like sporulation regulatory protein n=1 Tax=Caminicella sporogenes DSM 14501 TaxID=1121266 RepID=A0A1M6Q562_9FIRM|nr:aspartyl-phosphate phosphatase Spo0E family protein [Caminicella sporogenes]RKD23575.1 hypothetical protein BET04_04040 [Caminicella sporogenes]WIF93915.1 aspartyl-phosphate phosphatase Spo0E family protein [Caminicella sporogenes]SHK15258.1 Spo0E like sporulation regulatory protein [Caminicella sporogenes DSM 14501]
MSILDDNKNLIKEIDVLRKMLESHLSEADKPTEKEVVKISQELDKLIVLYYKKIGYSEENKLSE